MTTINRDTVRDLRPVIERAINEVLEKAGLEARAQIGRITFIPGQEFRGKITVNQVQKHPAKINARPQVGENWIFEGRHYRVEADNGAYFTVSRPSRARHARFSIDGRGKVANYRVKATDLQLRGVPA
jgi:hypothetical protein